MKKLMLRVTLLAMLLTAFAPLVLAQQQEAAPLLVEPAATDPAATDSIPTDPIPTDLAPTDPAPTDLAPTSPAPTDPAPTATPTAGPAVGCQELYQDPKAFCIVDKNGDITLPDGKKAHVVVDAEGAVFTVDENGNITHIGEGATFMMDNNITPSGVNQDNPPQGSDNTLGGANQGNPPQGNHNTLGGANQGNPTGGIQ
jgi:hypothetical protein